MGLLSWRTRTDKNFNIQGLGGDSFKEGVLAQFYDFLVSPNYQSIFQLANHITYDVLLTLTGSEY